MTIISKIKNLSVVAVLMALTASLYAPIAAAHGEKSQQAFLRMRTIHWYELNWSTDQVKVNDTMEVKGKMYVFWEWPETVNLPETAFLNIGIPGPVFTRQESYIGDRLVPRSVSLEPGKHYAFKVVLKARRPGDWHVHTMINVEGGGPIIGPGKWVTIDGSMADYKFDVQTLDGRTVNIETWGTGGIWGWHIFWFVVGFVWVWWWARRPTFLPRYIACSDKNYDGLITENDRKFSMAFLAATVVIVGFGYFQGNSNYPITIPLQAGVIGWMDPLPDPEGVAVKVDRAEYRVPGRSVTMTITVTNNTDGAIELGEMETGGIRFLNADVLVDDTGYPENMLADEGITMEDAEPIQPGETRSITFQATDAAWEVERLSDLIYDPDSRFGALLFFFDSAGNKYVEEIGGPMIPIFI